MYAYLCILTLDMILIRSYTNLWSNCPPRICDVTVYMKSERANLRASPNSRGRGPYMPPRPVETLLISKK